MSELLLIASTPLVAKTENIYRNTRKMHITIVKELGLLETLLLAIKMCTGFTTDVIWVNTKVYSVTTNSEQ